LLNEKYLYAIGEYFGTNPIEMLYMKCDAIAFNEATRAFAISDKEIMIISGGAGIGIFNKDEDAVKKHSELLINARHHKNSVFIQRQKAYLFNDMSSIQAYDMNRKTLELIKPVV
jgi:hypothetical protein